MATATKRTAKCKLRYFIETPGTDGVQAFVGTKGDRYLEQNLVEMAASAINQMLTDGDDECSIVITTQAMTDKQVRDLPEI